MPRTISAEFETRRDAETAVEHLVQDHGLDRQAVRIGPASDANTAGTRAAGSDLEDGRPEKTETEGEPALAGRIRVSADVDDALAKKVTAAFRTYGRTAASS